MLKSVLTRAYNSQMEDIRVETERLKEKAKRDIEAQHEKSNAGNTG